jgi:hypothetical protein
MENDTKTEDEVAEIVRRIEALQASPVLSIEEKIGIAKRLVSINDAENNALKTYRERSVRDTVGGLFVDGRRVRDVPAGSWCVSGQPNDGALLVRASAESK